MYSTAEKKELERIATLLMDSKSLGHTERMIVDAVIQDCKDKGEDLGKRLKDFMNEGRKAPH